MGRQRGAALVVGLVIMVVLTVLGITAARMAGLEERMAGNMRDRALALQAAEMALRDAERDLLGVGSRSIVGTESFWPNCNQDGNAGTADDGLCTCGQLQNQGFIADNARCVAGGVGYVNPVWTEANILTGTPSVAYGTFTGAQAITMVSAQPRYIIEGFRKNIAGTGGDVYFYRITARAQGANPNTVVWLQEVFKR
ncbi:MAG: hypothetical protein H6935_06605 [Thiobacillus sp.]|nr:hypothetical protein [Thiobacillus sp.]